MTKDKALHAWFNGFLPFYPVSSVPEDVIFPYGTYELITDSWEAGEIALTANLWYYTESEATPNAMAHALSVSIGPGGQIIPCDGGYIWIKRGSPWCQSMRDEADSNIKRRYINITVEYLAEN